MTPFTRATAAVLAEIAPIERAARALFLCEAGWSGIPAAQTDALFAKDRDWHIGRARAVLQAIREPSEAVIEAILDTVVGCWGPDEKTAKEIWHDAIDAAMEGE